MYPNQPNQTPYPNQQPPYPNSMTSNPGQMPQYPGQNYTGQMPSYPGQNPPYPSQSYPGQMPYPNQTYPSQMPSNPGQMPSNSNQMPTYPGQMPSYPSQMPSYPSQMPSYPGQMPSYPGQMPAYPGQMHSNPGQMPSYPQVPAYPNQGMPNSQARTQAQYPPQGAYHAVPSQSDNINKVNYSHQQAATYTQQQATMTVPRPTLTAISNFDPSNDAALLRKAMKGFGTDEDAIINVLCRRPNVQRMEIVKAYKTAYGKDLMADIKKETSGNFQSLLLALLTPMIHFYCQELSAAMRGTGTDEYALIEILCGGIPNHIIHIITSEYKKLYGQNLENALISETSYNFKRLLISCSTGNRDESMTTDVNSARTDAQALSNAGIGRSGTDESEFNRILCTRNFEQLKLIAKEYEKLTGNTLEKDIKKEFSGDVEDGMVAVLRCAISRPQFFAKCLHKSVAGLGTDDRALIRLCVTRSEIDLMDIKEEYQRQFKKSLKDAIKGDTSGHYKHALYVLIGENATG